MQLARRHVVLVVCRSGSHAELTHAQVIGSWSGHDEDGRYQMRYFVALKESDDETHFMILQYFNSECNNHE